MSILSPGSPATADAGNKNGSASSHLATAAVAVTNGPTSFLDKARGRLVVVLGDLMLDEWIIGSTSRISPEAPVPVVRFTERKTAPGGAANVAMNLLRLGAKVCIGGIIGDDEAGADLARELSEAGADVRGLVRDSGRPTTLKTRIVAQSQQQRQQMVRVDREWDSDLPASVSQRLADLYADLLDGAAVLCVSDYDKGFASCPAMVQAIQKAREMGVCVTGGPKPHNLSRFAGAHFLSLNQKETSEATAMKLDSDDALYRAGAALLETAQCEAVAITRSERGVSLFQRGQTPRHYPPHAVEVFDGVGAGDTFLAAASLALAGGSNFSEATELGNLAAAASVRHVGVVAVTPEEVRHVAAE